MPYTFIAAAAGLNDTTPAINSGAATVFFGNIGYTTVDTPTDNVGNTYLVDKTQDCSMCASVLHVGTPTNSAVLVASYPTATATVCVACFAGGSGPLDQVNGNCNGDATASAIKPGSITPSGPNQIVISSLSKEGAGIISLSAASLAAGWVLACKKESASGIRGSALAYQIQTTATLTDPEWEWTGGACLCSSVIASYGDPSPADGEIKTRNAVEVFSAFDAKTMNGINIETDVKTINGLRPLI